MSLVARKMFPNVLIQCFIVWGHLGKLFWQPDYGLDDAKNQYAKLKKHINLTLTFRLFISALSLALTSSKICIRSVCY